MRIRLQPLPFFSKPEEARKIVGEWPAYRVSTTHVMTMQYRIYDCFWQMRLPEVELGSEISVEGWLRFFEQNSRVVKWNSYRG